MAFYDQGIFIRTQSPRAGFGERVIAAAQAALAKFRETKIPTETIADLTHPEYNTCLSNWIKWRLVFEGGDSFVDAYLKKYSRREDESDFKDRKEIAPTPAFAKGAIMDIKNSIFQRMTDITRTGGPESYQQAIKGEISGVDLKGGTMNWFIGTHVLKELLVMKKVGVYIDSPLLIPSDPLRGPTLADKGKKHPYLYVYTAENIRSWVDDNGTYFALLLRDYEFTSSSLGLPNGETESYRFLWLDEDSKVNIQFFNSHGETLGESVRLEITEIPFVKFEITDSLLKDVANHQIALLNMESSDVGFCLKSNVPFYTEQYDGQATGSHLRKANSDGLPNLNEDGKGPIVGNQSDINIGTSDGRKYGKGLDRPEFIHPSPEPLNASILKQANLKNDIRTLVNLTLSSVQPAQASAESKQMDQVGLEAGLSSIGLELEHGERKIAAIWAMYEGSIDQPRVDYPQKYSLKSDAQRLDEADKYSDLALKVSSLKFKKELAKKVILMILADKINSKDLNQMLSEVDKSKMPFANQKAITEAIKDGYLSRQTVAEVLGLPDDEVDKAQVESDTKLAAIQAAQIKNPGVKNPAARGLPGDPNPNSGKDEKIGKQKRGAAK